MLRTAARQPAPPRGRTAAARARGGPRRSHLTRAPAQPELHARASASVAESLTFATDGSGCPAPLALCARGPLPTRVGVEQKRDHHRRVVRCAPVTIGPVGGIERRQLHLLDGRHHEPREVIVGQPLPHARRQQQFLLTVTCDEVLCHPEMVLTPPDGPPVVQQPPRIAIATRASSESAAARASGGQPGDHRDGCSSSKAALHGGRELQSRGSVLDRRRVAYSQSSSAAGSVRFASRSAISSSWS